jgi:hypothetical protein
MEFSAEAHRQSTAVAISRFADDDQGFIDGIRDRKGDG